MVGYPIPLVTHAMHTFFHVYPYVHTTMYMYMYVYVTCLVMLQGYQKVPETPLASCSVLKEDQEVWIDVQVSSLLQSLVVGQLTLLEYIYYQVLQGN